MKKNFFALMLICSLFSLGCKYYVNASGITGMPSAGENTEDTVEVNIKGFSNLKFTIYDEDYNIYKTGTFAGSTPIVIKHFKKGFYQISYSAWLKTGPSAGEDSSQYNTFEISESSLITIGTNTNSTTGAESFKFEIKSLSSSK